MATPKLFQPIRLGTLQLAHRVVMAPMTRLRANKEGTPLPHVKEYYTQRAHTPGTFIITEATNIAAPAGGLPGLPAAFTEENIAAWKEIVSRVHAQGCYIFLQIGAMGRSAQSALITAAGFPYVGISSVPHADRPGTPRALTQPEIAEYVAFFARCASLAVNDAGFDGVEIHNANGYLLNQALDPVVNTRTDEYGGADPANRARFPLEVVKAIADAIGEERTAVRISPWNTSNGMTYTDPKPTYTYFVSELNTRFPSLAYLHIIEPRYDGMKDVAPTGDMSNDFIREIWGARTLIRAGGFDRESALKATEEKDSELIAFGRNFVGNPDLVHRLKENLALTPHKREYFYAPGSSDPTGYTDYAFADAA
ncbi:NADH flavin oxidoreductase/NADH oxidase [Mycena chlorophos]|uniref:NADH flavin oxidoreductase/NADH oxidase n=1 Tax=Mycena chlorophos TaxID=658473 RepID=A0A8H6SAU8_MYCCL|nr:NADH flavin oxidoreductase/NADH oxidase [Mycena chlorophos]